MSEDLERARDYRERAAALLRLIDRPWAERQRTTLLELASLYHRMAEQLEDVHRLSMNLADDDPRFATGSVPDRNPAVAVRVLTPDKPDGNVDDSGT